MTDATDKQTLQTTETSLAIIDAIQDQNGAQLSDLVDTLEIARSTVYDHLTTLRKRGYVTKEGHMYHLGFKFLNLGKDVKYRRPGYNITEKLISEYTREVNAVIDFNVEDRGRVIRLYSSSSGHPDHQIIDPSHRLGQYYNMHNTSTGKAILAAQSNEFVEEVIEWWGLPRETEQTITERDALYMELEQIRDQGFAINNQEHATGIRAVGMAVHDPTGGIFGALSIGGPTYRISTNMLRNDLSETLSELVNEVEEAVHEQELKQ